VREVNNPLVAFENSTAAEFHVRTSTRQTQMEGRKTTNEDGR
jgi:hypothetical protein